MHSLPASQGRVTFPGCVDAPWVLHPCGRLGWGAHRASVDQVGGGRPSACRDAGPSPFRVIPTGEHLPSMVLLGGPAPFLLHRVWVT